MVGWVISPDDWSTLVGAPRVGCVITPDVGCVITPDVGWVITPDVGWVITPDEALTASARCASTP